MRQRIMDVVAPLAVLAVGAVVVGVAAQARLTSAPGPAGTTTRQAVSHPGLAVLAAVVFGGLATYVAVARARPGPVATPGDCQAERLALIEACIAIRDATASDGIRARADDGLDQAGVKIVEVQGVLFDPTQHQAAGVEPTTEAARNRTVAATVAPGFVDHGRVVRLPQVTVFRASSGS